ncbi:MAG: TrkA C-terminal domain-containing protein, partial [Opitutales bacterium]|nr:TrkA C-terminal domain-containing protein [Opitutales bacterium]
LVLLVGVGVIIGFGFWKHLRTLNSHFELMFLESFSEELENENEKRRRAMIKMVETKHPWDVEIRRLTVPPHSHLAGITLIESGLGQQTQTVLLAVGRDGFFINTVPPDYTFFPGDVLLLLGNKNQLAKAAQWVAVPAKQTSERNQGFDFEQLVLTDLHPLLNETIASANLRQRYGVNIVGIQRKDERIENLSPNDIFKVGDCLLLVGHRKNLDVLKNLGTTTASA